MNNKDKIELLIEFLFLIAAAILLFIMSGCAPQKRLNRLLDRYPELSVQDTIRIQDTINFEVPGVKVDSSVALDDAQRDTVVIREEHLTIRTFYNNDTIHISGECDTIREMKIREIEVPTKTPVYRRPRDGLQWYHWITISLGIVLIIILSHKLIRKRKARD